MSVNISDNIRNIDSLITNINSLRNQIDNFIADNTTFKIAKDNYDAFIQNSTEENFNKMIQSDRVLNNELESKHVDGDLYLEFISGDKLKEKIANDSKYTAIRYLIAKEFAKDNYAHQDMILGKYPLDFAGNTVWFLLFNENLIVSIAAFLGDKTPTYDENSNDNFQSFVTRENYQRRQYNAILSKYAINFLSNGSKCNLIKLGIEPQNKSLIDVYNRVGFTIEHPNKDNIYMYKQCTSYIPFITPSLDNGKLKIESFDLKPIIKWGYQDGRFINGNICRVDDMTEKLCSYRDPTSVFTESLYRTSRKEAVEKINEEIDQLSEEKSMYYYYEAKSKSEMKIPKFTNDDYTDYFDINIKKGYQKPKYGLTMFYLTEDEYLSNNKEVQIKAGKRYYSQKRLLELIKYDNRTLKQGIDLYREAFYDFRFIFLRIFREKPKDFYIKFKHPIFEIERLFYDCTHPHCFFDCSYDQNNLHPAIHPGEYAMSKNGLQENHIQIGIGAIYLLTWDYENFLSCIIHEFMHKFKDDIMTRLVKELFPDMLEWIKNLPIDELENHPIKPLEVWADLLAYSNIATLLDHTTLSDNDKWKMIQKMVSCICHTAPDDHHPSGNLRVNLLRSIPQIYELYCKMP